MDQRGEYSWLVTRNGEPVAKFYTMEAAEEHRNSMQRISQLLQIKKDNWQLCYIEGNGKTHDERTAKEKRKAEREAKLQVEIEKSRQQLLNRRKKGR